MARGIGLGEGNGDEWRGENRRRVTGKRRSGKVGRFPLPRLRVNDPVLTEWPW